MITFEPKSGKRVRDVRVTEDAISVDLFDGRTGYGIHWPDVDEDLTTQGLLQGAPAPRGKAKAA